MAHDLPIWRRGVPGNGRDGENNPSPWLNHPLVPPQPDQAASFVEYLRWMRVKIDDGTVDSGTILELFAKFENNDFSKTLNRLTERTKRLADVYFEASCPWRIRVGGIKGPESMLLPAFDALGMPYIPSSTLKGVARAIASQDASITEKDIKQIFGDINPSSSMGQVIFLDAYPLPGEGKQGGLMPDMANSIWKWNRITPPNYQPNPNNFLSLETPTFIIGLHRGLGCSDTTFNRVQDWLKKGLGQGIGSRVNTGYGALDVANEKPRRKNRILSIQFTLKGQLIHGSQAFSSWRPKNGGGWKPPGQAIAEVRPTAFRSMLRYWFRALALGVLSNQAVRDLELEVFGGIEPNSHTGLFRLEVANEQIIRDNAINLDEDFGLAKGLLILRNSPMTSQLPEPRKQAIEALLKNLTWLMFHLGGIGQGARRPCYSRQNRPSAPWWRGATLTPNRSDEFWSIPGNVNQFMQTFRNRLEAFYTALNQFWEREEEIDFRHPRTVTNPMRQTWSEIVDLCCQIVCVTGIERNNKPFALAVLHQVGRQGNNYDRDLCGSTARPSPVWISAVGVYQVVTVFGMTGNPDDPRDRYLQELQRQAGSQFYGHIWPFN